jgi:tetratricopeptide (TPR) repeat protein
MTRRTAWSRQRPGRRPSRHIPAVLGALALALLGGAAPLQAKQVQDQLSFEPPATLAGSYLAGRAASAVSDIGSAAAFYREALSADPGNPFLLERTFQLLVADGRIKEAVPLAERLIAKDKGNALARLTLGVEAMRKGQFERARAHFQATQTRPLSDLTVGILVGWTYAGQGDADAAFRVIDKLSGLEWYGVFKNFHTGLIAELSNRKIEAGKRLSAAYQADQGALRVVEAQARDLARNGKPDEAVQIIETFEKTIPDHPVIEALKADIKAGKQPSYLLATPQAGAAEFLYGLGAALGRDGGEDLASIYLQLALWLDPKAELPLISLATIQGRMKHDARTQEIHYNKAIEILGRIPADSLMRPLADIQVGRYYSVLQKFDQAAKALQAVLDRDPKDIDAVMALGDVLRASKKFGEAAEVYTRAISQIPNPEKTHWWLFYNRGICFERTKQWPKAEADFKKALELSPNEASVLNYLGYSWIDMGINLDQGLELIKKAVEQNPDDGYIVDSLGWAYYRLGRWDEAVKELEKAVNLKPMDAVINDHLGDAYWRVDRKLEATFQWNHARDNKPEPEELVKIEKKLREGLKDEPAPAAAQIDQTPKTKSE